MAHLWVNDASSNRRKRWEEVGKCVHLWETRGPLSLGKYVLRYLKHQCQQQEKKLQVKSNFKFVHFKVPTVSLKMESTYIHTYIYIKTLFDFLLCSPRFTKRIWAKMTESPSSRRRSPPCAQASAQSGFSTPKWNFWVRRVYSSISNLHDPYNVHDAFIPYLSRYIYIMDYTSSSFRSNL